MSIEEIQKRIEEIESKMTSASFWEDKQGSDKAMSELNDLKALLSKEKSEEVNYDSKDAIITIFSGAGGDDSEDFVRILLEMYLNYMKSLKWTYRFIHQHQNEHGGYKNVTIEIKSNSSSRGAYGVLKNESGVHRLVRISPFNANKQRHTSFAMVEVTPKFKKPTEKDIPEDEIEVDFAKSSGPGGQNVNKRETAVRMTHRPSGISVNIDSERTQHANREKARQILAGKLFSLREKQQQNKVESMHVSKTTEAEWGSQIRSYFFHPYQLVKDHRTGAESRNLEDVLDGDIQKFIEAEENLK